MCVTANPSGWGWVPLPLWLLCPLKYVLVTCRRSRCAGGLVAACSRLLCSGTFPQRRHKHILVRGTPRICGYWHAKVLPRLPYFHHPKDTVQAWGIEVGTGRNGYWAMERRPNRHGTDPRTAEKGWTIVYTRAILTLHPPAFRAYVFVFAGGHVGTSAFTGGWGCSGTSAICRASAWLRPPIKSQCNLWFFPSDTS